MEKNNFSYAKRIKVFAIPIMFLMIIVSVLTFVSAACQLTVLNGETRSLDSGNNNYDCVYVATGGTLNINAQSITISASQNITIKGTINSGGGGGGGAGGSYGELPHEGQAGGGPAGGGGGVATGWGGGGGGGSGASGGNGGATGYGVGGSSVGTSSGFDMYIGSGGGGGGNAGSICHGGDGGTGAGYFTLKAPLIDITDGNLQSKGGPGGLAALGGDCSLGADMGDGGGGSAGFIMLQSYNLSLQSGTIDVTGGVGGSGCTGSRCTSLISINGGGGGAGGRIKLFYKNNFTGSPFTNYYGGSGGAGKRYGISGVTGGTGTYTLSQSSGFNFLPGVILGSPANATSFYPQIGSATKIPWYYVCNQYDTPGYDDGSDLLKNNTFYLRNSTGGLIYSNTQTISGTSNSTTDYYTLDYRNYGNYSWSCYVCDNKSECMWSSTNNTFTVTQPLYNWLTTLVYDLLIAPSTINQNLWAISTTSNGNVSIGSLIAMANSTFSASSASAEANATNLPNNAYVDNVNFPVQLNCVNGGLGTGTSELDAFGIAIKTITCPTPASSASDNSVWTLQQNYSAPNKFDVYDDGIWQQQITATNNLLRIYTFAPAALLVTTYSKATIYNVTYSLNTNFMNITLGLPPNGSTITNPYYNFTATANVSLNLLKNASIHIDNVPTINLILNGTNTSLSFPVTSMGIGNHNWHVEVCDNANNCKESETRTFYNNYFITVNQSYSPTAYETDSQTFSVIVRYDTSSQPEATAQFIYGGTVYTNPVIKSTNGTDVNFTTTINLPVVTGTTIKSFYWNVTLSSGNYQTTPSTNQTINDISFSVCGGPGGSTAFVNFIYLNELDATPVNLSVPTSSFTYWIGSGTTTQTYFYSSSTLNSNLSFCFTPPSKTLYIVPMYQYGATGTFPIRTYQTIVPPYLTLTNSTTNINLYALSYVDSGSITIQVIDPNSGNVIPNARVTITRAINGIQITIFDGYTDSAGTVNTFLSTVTPYTITASKEGCGSNTQTVIPVGSYNMQLNCASNFTEYISQIQGVSYQRSPADGVNQPGLITYSYSVSSSINNITAAKFILTDDEGTIVGYNETNVSSGYSWCTSSKCFLTSVYNTGSGDNIKGKYYVNLGNITNFTYVLLEGDAHWRFIIINSNLSQTGITRFADQFNSFFYQWEADGRCNEYLTTSSCAASGFCKWVNNTGYSTSVQLCVLKDDYNKAEFSRVVLIFFGIVVVLFIIGKTTGYEMTNPGSFVMFMAGAIIIMSILGFFRFNGATPNAFMDQYIYAAICLMFSIGYNISIIRRYSA